MVLTSKKPLEEKKISTEQKNEVTGQSKSEPKVKFQHLEDEEGLWSMDFNSDLGKEGVGIGFWIQSHICKSSGIPSNVRECSYKLAFDCSNNESEYESLITGLKILKKLGAKKNLCLW